MSTRREAADRLSRTVGRYEIVQEIGRGGMASVYVARQLDLDRRVALKELRALRTFDPSFAQRFLREARLAGSFSHPNIVTVHEYFEHEGVPYIAMEYLARGSLRPFVGRLTLPQIGGVLEGLLAGLSHAESHDVVHRDIKPENLLVTDEGGVKIADFGIAKATYALETNPLLTAVGTTVGTPNYIAPEQAMARALGPWTDLYSVGIVAFELFVGRPPFGDSQEPMAIVLRQINEPVPRVSDLVTGVDPWISDWVNWLVSKAPAERPQSAAQAWDALEEALLRLLGPRWRRQAALLMPGDPAAVPGSNRVTAVGARAAGLAAAGGSAADRSERSTRLSSEPRLAATVPPRPQDPGAPPAAPPRRLRRVPTALKMAGAAAVLFAAGAFALNAHQNGSTTASQTPATTSRASTGAPALPSRKASPKKRASTLPATTSAAAAQPSIAGRAAAAGKLARTYENSAAQITKRSNGRPLSSADARIVTALRQTARAYRAAAAAATRNDVTGYTTALADAAQGRKQVSSALNASLRGSSTSTAPTTTRSPAPAPAPAAPAPVSPCAGDSTSDDPSDDACGGP